MSMQTLFKGLTVAALLALSGPALPALAQETDATDTQAADDLSMGVEAGGIRTKETAQVNEGYLAETFESWELRCIKTEDGKDPCELFQSLKDDQGNAVAEFSIFGLPAGGKAAAGGTLMAPLETLLTANLTIQIDSAPAKIYPFTFCTQAGCVARVGFTAEEVAAFKKGNAATVTIVPAVAPDQPVKLAVSLKGFTAGFDAAAATVPAP